MRMTRRTKIAIWASAAIIIAIAGAVFSKKQSGPKPVTAFAGAILREDSDPRKQLPIANAEITVAGNLSTNDAKSDTAGFYHVTLNPGVTPDQMVELKVRHPEYEPLNISQPAGDQIYILRMSPISRETRPVPQVGQKTVANIRVRYAVKSTTAVNVGSAVKTFEVVNTGNVSCNHQPPCSPDGKWKATIASSSLDAGEGNEFHSVRVSCMAGPCPFTRIESDNLSHPGRIIHVSARNWSDTATFLIEAEVVRTMASDVIRQSYPVIFGQEISFTLPATAQGPSIEAEVDGSDTVFPFGPKLTLPWAACTLKIDADQTKLYRCELKSEFRFQ
jgi:hypothetical protein